MAGMIADAITAQAKEKDKSYLQYPSLQNPICQKQRLRRMNKKKYQAFHHQLMQMDSPVDDANNNKAAAAMM